MSYTLRHKGKLVVVLAGYLKEKYTKYMKTIKSKLKQLKQDVMNPRFSVTSTNLKLKSFGSDYGGWVFADSESLKSSIILSCGLGEDASFDVEIAEEYGLKVVIVDPTPRALRHFSQIMTHLGRKKTHDYFTGGKQSVSSYNLENLAEYNFKIIPKAIWVSDLPVRFYSPPIAEHVSHSILNYQNNYSVDTPYIEVEAITMKQIIEGESLQDIPLLKLDIEGAEVEVIINFLNEGIFPEQILVEFDELHVPSLKARQRIISCHKKLIDNDYVLVNISGSNYLYLSKKAFVI